MRSDIVPGLLQGIEKTYKDLIEKDKVLFSLAEKIKSGTATYADAAEFAGRIGQIRSDSFLQNLSVDILPDGKLHYNIANRIVPPSLELDFQTISEACTAVQEGLNDGAGIHIKPQVPEISKDRINGLVNRLSGDDFEKVQWILKSPIENFARSVVDDHVKANADFHYHAGLSPKIIRRTDGHCCKWCSNLAGTYDYSPGMSRDVFRRHENCGCTVEYDPGDGSKRRQNVWDKSWSKSVEKPLEIKGLGVNSSQAAPLQHKPPRLVKTIDPNDKKEIDRLLSEYEDFAVNLDYETAMVITSDGKVYMFDGTKTRVFVDDLGDELIGSVVSHNHPADETAYSFSNDDFELYVKNRLDQLYGFDVKYKYKLSRDESITKQNSDVDWMTYDGYQHNVIFKKANNNGIGYLRWKK